MSVVTQHPPALSMSTQAGSASGVSVAGPGSIGFETFTCPPPSNLRIVPSLNEEQDKERWQAVEKAIRHNVLTHHVEFYNQHTKAYMPNYSIHAAFALYRLNATPAEISERYQLEARMLDPLPKTGQLVLDASNWESAVGQGRDKYPALLKFFATEIERLGGMVAAVRVYFPRFVAGLGGDILHPLVQLGLALEIGHPALAAEALAFMAYTYKPLVQSLAPPVEDDYDVANVLEILQDIREDERFDGASICKDWASMEYHRRVEKLRHTSDLCKHLSELAAQWKFDSDSELGVKMALEQLVDSVVLAFATTGRVYPTYLDFPLAHVLIACNALHRVMPFCVNLNDKSHLLRRFLLTFLAVYISQGRPNPHPERLESAYPQRRSSVTSRLQCASSPPNSNIVSPSSSMVTDPQFGVEAMEHEGSDEEDVDVPAGAYLPVSPPRLSKEWMRLCNSDDVHCHEAVASLFAFSSAYGSKGGLYMKAAKILRNAEERSGSGREWEYRGCGYPPSSSFQLSAE